MAYGLDTLTDFQDYLISQGFDTNSTSEIIGYLSGVANSSNQISYDFENGANPTFDPNAQVDISGTWTTTIDTDGGNFGNPRAALDVSDANFTVTGSNDVVVGASSGVGTPFNGDNQINLDDTGNDKVFLGTGDNTVNAGGGRDTIFGGTGSEFYNASPTSLIGSVFDAGTGDNQFWDYGSADNTYIGGSNTGDDTVYLHNSGSDTIDLGNGTDSIQATFSTGDNSLVAGSGADTILSSAEADAGHNTLVGGTGLDSLYAGDGGDTLESGSASGGTNSLYDFSIPDSPTTNPGVTGNTLEASADGNDGLYAHSSANDTLISGTGNGNDYLETSYSTGADSIVMQGSGSGTDTATLTDQGLYSSTVDATASSDGVVIDAYTGNSTIDLGSGSDSVNINTQNEGGTGYSGATDSIQAGTGQDNVYFIGTSGQSPSTQITTTGNTTTVAFNGESVDVTTNAAAGSDVTLWFTDKSIDLH